MYFFSVTQKIYVLKYRHTYSQKQLPVCCRIKITLVNFLLIYVNIKALLECLFVKALFMRKPVAGEVGLRSIVAAEVVAAAWVTPAAAPWPSYLSRRRLLCVLHHHTENFMAAVLWYFSAEYWMSHPSFLFLSCIGTAAQNLADLAKVAIQKTNKGPRVTRTQGHI